MKEVICIFLSLLILAGCKGETESVNIERPSFTPTVAETETSASELPDSYVRVNQLNFYYPIDLEDSYYNLLGWENYIQEKFGIELYVNHRDLYPSSIFYLNDGEKYSYSNRANVRCHLENPTRYISSMAIDMKAYYEKYGWDRYIDQKYIDGLTFDGRVLAVPSAPDKFIAPRYYNEKYLVKLNVDVPSNPSELYEFLSGAKAANKNDPSYYPMFVSRDNVLPCISDILRSFGAYASTGGNTACAFNPVTETYEDAVFSEEFSDALTYIRNLQGEGLFGIHGEGLHNSRAGENIFIGDIFRVSKDFASEYQYIYNDNIKNFSYFTKVTPDYEYKKGYYLTHSNDKKVCEIRADMAFYVFRGTDIAGVADLFNQIMTDHDFYADLRYGMEGEEYITSQSGVIPVHPKMGRFADIKQIIPPEDPHAYGDFESLEVIKTLPEQLTYEISFINDVTTYTDDTERFRFNRRILDALFCDTVPAAEAVNEYRKLFLELGLDEVVRNLNEKLGKVPVYDYNY